MVRMKPLASQVANNWESVTGGVNADIWFMMALIFVLGFFIEWIEISYIAVPLFLPVLIAQGVDPVWLAMLITVNLQSSFLTPPFDMLERIDAARAVAGQAEQRGRRLAAAARLGAGAARPARPARARRRTRAP